MIQLFLPAVTRRFRHPVPFKAQAPDIQPSTIGSSSMFKSLRPCCLNLKPARPDESTVFSRSWGQFHSLFSLNAVQCGHDIAGPQRSSINARTAVDDFPF